MYNRITFKYNGIITKGILLGECDFIEQIADVIEEKKFLFFSSFKRVFKDRKFKIYLVFIPWKHAVKDIVFIDERQIISIDHCSEVEWIIIDRFISKYTKDEYVIENFKGYKFIYDNNEFIANLRNGLGKYYLETLYSNIPSIIEEEFDEDTAVREYPVFITSNEREEGGTGFIELQYCKRKMPRIIAVRFNNIKHWNKESLYIGVESFNIFLDQYFDIFKSVNKNLLDIFSPEYFILEQVKQLREKILEKKPIDYKILVSWLDECIEKGYSMYFLGV